MKSPGLNTEFAARKQRTATLRHEAGHLVVAHRLGFPTGYIKLTPTHAAAEIELRPSLTDISAVISYIERRIKVLFAGSMAETLSHGKISDLEVGSLLKSTASDDFSKIREHLKTLVGCQTLPDDIGLFQEKLDATNAKLFNEAADLVCAESKTIVDLTSLFSRKHDTAVRKQETDQENFSLSEENIAEFLSAQKST